MTFQWKDITQRYVIGLILLTLAVFANCLLNGFSGDDHTVIVNNTFFENPGNISRLFQKNYLSDSQKVFRSAKSDKGSGSVAYRPVLSLSYFFDSFVWGKAPFGFHLTSVLFHLFNVICLFFLVKGLSGNPRWAFWAAAIFAVHPLQSEPVSAIGFRADLMACSGVLASALSWHRYRSSGSRKAYGLALVGYALAVLSKENALLLPIWLWAYDRLKGIHLRKSLWAYAGLCATGASYLFIYFIVFRNTTLGQSAYPANFLPFWVAMFPQIWLTYLKLIFVPFLAVPMPGVYYFWPYIVPSPAEAFLLVILLGVLMGWLFLKLVSKPTLGKLAILWAFLFFLPASGVIPNPNPIACRYLYLPLAGIAVIISGFMIKLFDHPWLKRISPSLGTMLASVLVFSMALFSVINNSVWKNNFSMGAFWARTFPDFYKGHVMYGEELYNHGLYPEALSHFESALDDPRFFDPDGLYNLVRTYLKLGKDQVAERLNEAIMVEYPWYARGHFVRAQLAFRKKDYPTARREAYQAIQQGSEYEDFFFLLNLADQTADDQMVDDVIREARARIFDPLVLKAFEKAADQVRSRIKSKLVPGHP